MKQINMQNISRLRSNYIKRLSESDIDYELPFMMLVVVFSVLLMLAVTI